jgi:hypothetical protein
MKTEHKDVSAEELMKALGPELMQFIVESLHTSAHEDANSTDRKPVDKADKPSTSK